MFQLQLFSRITSATWLGMIALLLGMACVPALHADTVTIDGTINQSTQDGTGPATNNPSLNDILHGASYTVDLSFAGSIASPGIYDLAGFSLLFSVPAAGAIEKSFDSVSMTVAKSGNFARFSVVACLATGSGCNQGNQLDLNFMIPSVDLNSQNVAAQVVPDILPLALMEDDGNTQILGSVATYSYTSGSPVPEPSAFVVVAPGLIAIALKRRSKHPFRQQS